MKPASVKEIREELKGLSAPKLVELCLRLARHKKENKELLTFLLFEADEIENYVKEIKGMIDESFAQLNTGHVYPAVKSLRKMLRYINKYTKYTASKTVEADLLIYFCKKLTATKLPVKKNAALLKIYNGQLKKIKAAIATLHIDLQHDYAAVLKTLSEAFW